MNTLPTLALAIVGLVYLTAVQCHNNRGKYLENMKRYAALKCGNPQPRAFSLEEIDSELWNKWKGNEIRPAATVLHRCESSGCCPESMRCEANEHEQVTLYFFVRGEHNRTFEPVKVTNHSSCQCLAQNGGQAFL